MQGAKSFEISKQLVWEAYLKVKSNQGSAGVDNVTILDFEKNLKGNLYKIWNRMSSGSYMPPPVRLIEIPKSDGKMRTLGIPTVADKIAQMVVVMMLEPTIDPHFHEWCSSRQINIQYIQPGRPMQNAYIERFNKTYSGDVLDAYLFENLE